MHFQKKLYLGFRLDLVWERCGCVFYPILGIWKSKFGKRLNFSREIFCATFPKTNTKFFHSSRILSPFSSTTISMTTDQLSGQTGQQPLLSPTWSQTPATNTPCNSCTSQFHQSTASSKAGNLSSRHCLLLHHPADPVLAHIVYLHVNRLLHQHPNDHHLQISLLASSSSIELVSSSARVISVKS